MSLIGLPTGGRRYLGIAKDIADRIDSGEYAAGDRLPPERELAAQLEVSRTTVREALLALEIQRYVEIRVSSGVFVLPAAGRDPDRGALAEQDAAGPWEVLEARRLIEGYSAYTAAQRIDDAQLAEMERCNERMADALDDIPRFDAADAEFHLQIAAASGNAVIESYVGHLWKMRQSAMWEIWYDKTRQRKNRVRSVEDHSVILRALQRRLPDAAQTAMRAHLDVLAERFFQLNL